MSSRVKLPGLASVSTQSRLGADDVVKVGELSEGAGFLSVVRPAAPGVDLAAWLAAARDRVRAMLVARGGLLFRGFEVPTAGRFGEVARAFAGELLGYLERAATRHEVAANVFTSTELSRDQTIPLHHEMSYSHNWPSRLYFYCSLPSRKGGRTPVANDRRVVQRIAPEVRAAFGRHGVMYVRNYRPELEPWQSAFQTNDRAVVESYFRASNVDWQWLPDDGLRTRQVRQALARHPETSELVWFNHAHLFHVSNLPAEVRETLLSSYGEEGLPRNAYLGDGTRIAPAMLDQIRDIYREEAIAFEWQRGDVLLLDNFLTSHGREPFEGEREILVAMSDLYTNHQAGLH